MNVSQGSLRRPFNVYLRHLKGAKYGICIPFAVTAESRRKLRCQSFRFIELHALPRLQLESQKTLHKSSLQPSQVTFSGKRPLNITSLFVAALDWVVNWYPVEIKGDCLGKGTDCEDSYFQVLQAAIATMM